MSEIRTPGANIPIRSVPNVRDLGGWPTRDGGTVRRGLLYRGTELDKLAGDDMATFAQLGIRTVFDLRTEDERMAQPDRVPESTAQVVCDVLADEHSAAPAQGSRAMFEAGASFNGAQVEGSADFSEASFPNKKEQVDFDTVIIGKTLTCVGARFRGPVNFGSLRCEGPGWFNYAWFENKETVDFTFTYFGGSLSLETVNFAGPVDMYMAHISRGLILRNAEFQQGLTLYAATTERLVLGEPGNEFSFSFDGRLDLREFTFRMISGSKQQAERFVRAQDPTTFSMFPYIQLEQHYRNIGDGAEARSIYYCARNDRRRFAKEANDSTNWTLGRRWSDSAYKWFVGYGVKPARLLSLIFIFTLLGMIVYWPDYALVPVESTVPSGGEAPPGGEFGTSFTEKVTSRLAYSVDLLVPSANVYGITFGELGISEGLSPNGRLPQLYAGLHQTIGYLLIGLFIAIYTGVLRRF